jgi:hypothetical protein
LNQIFEYLKLHLAQDLHALKSSPEGRKPAWSSSTFRNPPWQPRKIFYVNMLGHAGPLDNDSLSMIDLNASALAQANQPTLTEETLGDPKSVGLTHLTILIGSEPSGKVPLAWVQHESDAMDLNSEAGTSTEQVRSHHFAHFSHLIHYLRYRKTK